MKIYGYLQLYFKIIGQTDTHYGAFDGDFQKPLGRIKLWSIKRNIKKAYQSFDNIQKVEFCSQEEYEAGCVGRECMKVTWAEEESGGME